MQALTPTQMNHLTRNHPKKRKEGNLKQNMNGRLSFSLDQHHYYDTLRSSKE